MSLIAHHISVQSDNAKPRLNGVSCEIHPGTITILIGPNGSGKTSLIRCLAGELAPSTGHVSLDDTNLKQFNANQLAQHRAVLPQHTELSFPFRVKEVISLGRSPYQSHQQNDQHLVEAAMAEFDITALSERWYTTLSGGEKQRVQLARVWVQTLGDTSERKPTTGYLLLDEPTSALDLRHKQNLMTLLSNTTHQSNEKGPEKTIVRPIGVIAALHNLGTAARYADQLILLNHGKVVAAGTPQSVLSKDNIEQVYGISVEFLHYQQSDREPIAIPE